LADSNELIKGPPVPEEVSWTLRVRIKRRKAGGSSTSSSAEPPAYTTRASTGTAVTMGSDRTIRWVLIARHAWNRAEGNLENILIFPTQFVNGQNRPAAEPIGVNDHIEGLTDMVAVRLVTPIEIPDGVDVPPLDWDHIPMDNEETVQLGFGGEADNVLRRIVGRVTGTQPDGDNIPETVLIIQEIEEGDTSQHGDSGGPIIIDDRIVGIHRGRVTLPADADSDDPVETLWTPLHQEQPLRRELEARINTITITPGPDGGMLANITCPSTSSAWR
jgi:hypothetical protein